MVPEGITGMLPEGTPLMNEFDPVPVFDSSDAMKPEYMPVACHIGDIRH